MPGSTILYGGNGPVRTRHGYYTGLNINATKASRTAIASGTSITGGKIGVGDVLIRDPFGHDKGVGMDFTQPATSYLHEQALVVVQVLEPKARGADTPKDGLGNAHYPQEFIGVEAKEGVLARTNASMYTGYTLLGLSNGSTALVALGASGLGGAGVSVGALTNSTGGTVGTTLAAIGAGTAYDQADQVAIKNAIASLGVAVNNIFAYITRGKGICIGSTEGTGVAIGQAIDTSSTAVANKLVRFGNAGVVNN